MKRIKFDNRICDDCQHYYGCPNAYCHIKGPRIDNGVCLYYEEVEPEPSETELKMREYEYYMEEYN